MPSFHGVLPKSRRSALQQFAGWKSLTGKFQERSETKQRFPRPWKAQGSSSSTRTAVAPVYAFEGPKKRATSAASIQSASTISGGSYSNGSTVSLTRFRLLTIIDWRRRWLRMRSHRSPQEKCSRKNSSSNMVFRRINSRRQSVFLRTVSPRLSTVGDALLLILHSD